MLARVAQTLSWYACTKCTVLISYDYVPFIDTEEPVCKLCHAKACGFGTFSAIQACHSEVYALHSGDATDSMVGTAPPSTQSKKVSPICKKAKCVATYKKRERPEQKPIVAWVPYEVNGKPVVDEFNQPRLRRTFAGSERSGNHDAGILSQIEKRQEPEAVIVEFKMRLLAAGHTNKSNGSNVTKYPNYMRKIFMEGTFKTRDDFFADGALKRAKCVVRRIAEVDAEHQEASAQRLATNYMHGFSDFVQLVSSQSP